mgnify:CR=1 FL=1
MKRKYYSPEELVAAWKADLLNDAENCEKQALNGPYYPEKGITKDNLLLWAAEYRMEAEKPIPKQFAYSKVPNLAYCG